MYDDYTQDDLVLPEFDEINDLQLFDSSFTLDCPFRGLNDQPISFN